MSDDFQILLLLYVLNFIIGILVYWKIENRKIFAVISLAAIVLYSILFIISYLRSGPGGGVLAVWIFWYIFLSLQLCFNIVFGVYLVLKKYFRPLK